MPEPSWEDLEKQLSASMLPNKDDDPLRVEREAAETAEKHQDILSTLPPLEGIEQLSEAPSSAEDILGAPVPPRIEEGPQISGTPALSQMGPGAEPGAKIEELKAEIVPLFTQMVTALEEISGKLDDLLEMP